MTPKQFLAWRTRMGWTQAEAGDALGVSERQVRRYESGEQGISETIAKLCKVMEKTK